MESSNKLKLQPKECFVSPLIRNSLLSSNCEGEFIPIKNLNKEYCKQTEVSVILDRCGIYDEEQLKYLFPDQMICEHHRKQMFEDIVKSFLKYKHYNRDTTKCMWKNHINNPGIRGKKRRKSPYTRIRTMTKNRSKLILQHLDWFIPFGAIICNKCDKEISSLLKTFQTENLIGDDLFLTVEEDNADRRKKPSPRKFSKDKEITDQKVCPNCNITFKNLEALDNHGLECKTEEKNGEIVKKEIQNVELINENENGEDIICDYCEFKGFHPKEKHVKCNICGDRLVCKLKLLSHMKKKHEFICEYCETSYTKQSFLDTHLENVHGITFPTFKLVSSSDKKDKEILENKKILNTSCYRVYSTANALAGHNRIHKKKMKHTCKYCGGLLCRKETLLNHIKRDHKNNKRKSLKILALKKKTAEKEKINKKMNEVDPLATSTKVRIILVNLKDFDLTLNVPKEPKTITLADIKKNYMPEKDPYIYYAKTFDEETGIRFFEHWENDLKILPLVDGQITLKCYSRNFFEK